MPPSSRNHLTQWDMKSKYCFIRRVGELEPNDVIYQVWVGSYLSEFTKLTLVQEFCKDCGLYFEKWSPQVDSHLDKAKARFSLDANPIASPFRSASVTISKLYAMIIDDSFATFEKNLPMTPSEKWMQFHHSLSYYQSISKTNVIQNAHLPRRINLSSRNRVEGQKALFCTICIIILIAIDAVVSHFMNW